MERSPVVVLHSVPRVRVRVRVRARASARARVRARVRVRHGVPSSCTASIYS
jgi:hypothetical protein